MGRSFSCVLFGLMDGPSHQRFSNEHSQSAQVQDNKNFDWCTQNQDILPQPCFHTHGNGRLIIPLHSSWAISQTNRSPAPLPGTFGGCWRWQLPKVDIYHWSMSIPCAPRVVRNACLWQWSVDLRLWRPGALLRWPSEELSVVAVLKDWVWVTGSGSSHNP